MRHVYHANCILATARACTRPCNEYSNNMRFRFHLARRERELPIHHMAPEEEVYAHEVFAGRKLSTVCAYIMFHVPRTHREGHAMRARAPLFFFGTVAASFVSLEGPEAGVNCQLLERPRDEHRIFPSECTRPCVVPRERLLIGTRVRRVHKCGIDWHIYTCTCLTVCFAIVIRGRALVSQFLIYLKHISLFLIVN